MSRHVASVITARKFGSTSRKAVMLVLAEYADVDWSTICGQERIAAEAELSERTVREVLKAFEEEQLIARERRYRPDGYRTSDRIRLNRAAIETLPAAFAGRYDEAPTVDQKPKPDQALSETPTPIEISPAAASGEIEAHRQLAQTSPATGADLTGNSFAGYPLVEPLVEPRARRQRITDADLRALALEKAKAKGAHNPEGLANTIFTEDYDQLRAELVALRARAIADAEISECPECDDRGFYDHGDTLTRCTHPTLRSAS